MENEIFLSATPAVLETKSSVTPGETGLILSMPLRPILLFVLTFITSTALPYELVGTVIGITDGDTLKLLVDRKQYKIRLAEIDTPEKGQPWGKNATKALSEKVFREEVRIDVIDTDRYSRLIGRIWLGGRDINRELVSEGHAWMYRQYMTDRSLLEDEESARSKLNAIVGR